MASAATPYSGIWKLYKPHMKHFNVLNITIVALLCSISFLLGVWQRSGTTTVSTTSLITAVPCGPVDVAFPTSSSSETPTQLDFAAHHSANDLPAIAPTTRHFPACDAELSEYTPCEDVHRSLKFERDRLIYRERHCPAKAELLKCLIPAPLGYRTPFPWPVSRELAWFANVPHKELTVEKAVQNWIRVEGDKFRFPGGGTMFPNGADAYIDDIDSIISLSDGSIRTAIDTGCGVSCLLPLTLLRPVAK